MSRMILILVIGGFILYGVTNISLNKNVNEGTQTSVDSYSQGQARNIANSVAQMALSKLADDNTWRVNSAATISIFGGTASYTVEDYNGSSSSGSGSSVGSGEGEGGGDHEGGGEDDNNHEGDHSSALSVNSQNLAFGGWYGEVSGKNGDNSNGGNGYGNEHGNGGNGHGKGGDDGGDDGNGGSGCGGGGKDDGSGGSGSSGGSTVSQIKVTVNSNYNNITKHVEVIASFPGSSSKSVPAFMDYALLCNNNISLNGNVNIADDDNTKWNANVRTNADFQMNGNNEIKGFMYYNGNAHSNPSWRLNSQIVPNVNSDGSPNYSQVSKIDIPNFNPNDYKSTATVTYNSNKFYSGNISLGSKDSPEIIYVNGDLNLSGNISGYGVFIVKGNIIINGNVKINDADPNASNLGLYATGDINANGNSQLHAQILTNSNVNLNGNVKVYGSVTARGGVNFNGNVNIYYHPANSSLTQPFWPESSSNSAVASDYGMAKSRLIVDNWLE